MIQFPFIVKADFCWITVPLPLIVKFPLTTRFLERVIVVATAPPIVIELQEEDAFTVGWLEPVKLASPIIAFIVEVGIPAVQFPA